MEIPRVHFLDMVLDMLVICNDNSSWYGKCSYQWRFRWLLFFCKVVAPLSLVVTPCCIIHVDAAGSHSSGLSCSNRGHHVPAFTVTSGGRGVGFDMGCM